MVNDTYDLESSRDNTLFYFVSEGRQGWVVKVIIITKYDEPSSDKWNLGFGDLKDGDVDTLVVTNNNDLGQVMRTVAKAALLFLITHPEATLIIKPADARRQRLYNRIFRQHQSEIEQELEIMGYFGSTENHFEPYQPTVIYDFFSVKFKSV
jgi:hypothetical protein